MKIGDESRTGYTRRYLLALVFAVLFGLGAAVPVFAAEEPAGEDEGTIQPQVVGGEPVDDGEYKFMAVLRDITWGNTVREQRFCGGTLIDRDSVLTAAHCLRGRVPAQLRVTVGRTVLSSSEGQGRRVVASFVHPKYDIRTSDAYDVAVLTLDRRVKNIAPVSVPEEEDNTREMPGESATVAGWGNTIKQGPNYGQPDRLPNRMQEAQVPVISDRKAKRAYEPKYDYVKALMLAAGEEGKDTCQGDSGGPIFVKEESGEVFQIGITSFGEGCGVQGYPGVYTEANADAIRPFIYRAAGR